LRPRPSLVPVAIPSLLARAAVKIGDAHGKVKKQVSAQPRHAELAGGGRTSHRSSSWFDERVASRDLRGDRLSSAIGVVERARLEHGEEDPKESISKRAERPSVLVATCT